MTRWIESRIGDITLRAAGAALVVSAWYEAQLLRHIQLSGPAQASLRELGLAAILFLSTSFGLALLILGHHIGDRITLSDRWTRRFPSRPQPSRRPSDRQERG
ncbi:MAG TPA: hypothetical protein VF503_05135 [Sphingobium sp.]|uniref:hypothetical protein n=1 Tax=Sphingobium sp. TaxID=1912891 RepID=UPI002ED21F60